MAQNPIEILIELTVFDEVASGLRLRGVATEQITERVYRFLRWVNLDEMRHWPVNVLSFGQKSTYQLSVSPYYSPKF